jgi:hypothetical protein
MCAIHHRKPASVRLVQLPVGSRSVDRPPPGAPIKALLLAAALMAVPVAEAREGWGGDYRFRAQDHGQQVEKGYGRPPHGGYGKRPERDKRHHGRLTEQERRDLHRDLDRANREIYKK